VLKVKDRTRFEARSPQVRDRWRAGLRKDPVEGDPDLLEEVRAGCWEEGGPTSLSRAERESTTSEARLYDMESGCTLPSAQMLLNVSLISLLTAEDMLGRGR